VAEFQVYVKPAVYPRLSDFCKNLTGIQQEWVDKGVSIQDAMKQYDAWLKDHKLFKDEKPLFAFVTCGDWDLKTCLPKQCLTARISKPHYFNSWINIKKAYADFYKRRMVDMVKMLEGLNIPLEGKHHSGIDDCKNITKIVQRMLKDSAILTINGSYRPR